MAAAITEVSTVSATNMWRTFETKIKHMPLTCNPLWTLLQQARTERRKSRTDNKVMIVLTDGKDSSDYDIQSAHITAVQHNITIFAIGVGQSTQPSQKYKNQIDWI